LASPYERPSCHYIGARRADPVSSCPTLAVVEIDLRDDAFRAGKKGFERTKKLLREWPGRTDLFDQLAGVTGRSAEQQGEGRTWDVLFAFLDQEGELEYRSSLDASGER
jgi:hypothetical protein